MHIKEKRQHKVRAFALCLIALISSTVAGQDKATNDCKWKNSYLLESVDPLDQAALEFAVERYRAELKRLGSQSIAFIAVFGGRESYFGEVDQISEKAWIALRLPKDEQIPGGRLFPYHKGYREMPALEFWIRPGPCSLLPTFENELPFSEIEFKEAPAADTRFLSDEELLELLKMKSGEIIVSHLSGRTEVRVNMIFDSSGKVIFSFGSGWPMFRFLSVRDAMSYKLDLTNEKNKSKFYRGTYIVEYRAENAKDFEEK